MDDDPGALALCRTILEGNGHAVLEAGDARSALTIVNNHRVDLVLIDMVLPDRSGMELARDIRAIAGCEAVPLAAMSAASTSLDEARLSPLGFSECLSKPFDQFALLAAIEPLLPSPKQGTADIGGGRRVLIVDDDRVLLRLQARRMELLGFEVQSVSSAAEAIALCADQPPDAVISDVLMPVTDGFALCLALRRSPATQTIPIVLVSSHYLEPEDEELARAVGATDYVTRDATSNEVPTALIAALDNRTPPPTPTLDADRVAAEHAVRVSRQLARQMRLNALLRERSVFQQALLAVTASIAESLGGKSDPEDILGAGLAPIVSAKEIRAVLGFLLREDGSLNCALASGAFPPGQEELWGRLDLVERAIELREVVVVQAAGGGAGADQEWLCANGLESLLIVPIDASDDHVFGAVVLLTVMNRVSTEVFSFARALRHTLGRAVSHGQAQRRFLQAQKMDALGRLASGIAHDFNNLLTAISGFATLAAARLPEPDPLREYMEQINKTVERGAGLTEQLLTFGREQKRPAAAVVPDRVIGHMVPMLERLIGREVEIITALACSREILIDPGHLEQVLVNLIVNARDALTNGGTIRIQTRVTRPGESSELLGPAKMGGGYCVIEVRDNGQGMSPETQARAFEPFFTTKEPGAGTGLGLSTVFGIVGQSNGTITLNSSPNVGTSVQIVLPLAGADASAPRPGNS